MPINYNIPPVLHSAMIHAEPQGNLTGASVHEQLLEVQQKAQIDNYLVNSSFEVAQDGAGTFTTSDSFPVDQVKMLVNGSSMSVTRQAFSNGQTDVPNNPLYFLRSVVVSATNASEYAMILFPIEGVETLSGKTATLSFWAKADSAKKITFRLQQVFGSGGSPSTAVDIWAPQTFDLTVNWQKISYCFTIPSITGKTKGTNGNDCLIIYMQFDSNPNGATHTNTGLSYQSGTFDIACPKLEAGTVATPWVREDPSVNWARCLRFYEVKGEENFIAARVDFNTGFFFSPKRATPTITMFGNPQVANTVYNIDLAANATINYYGISSGKTIYYITHATGIATSNHCVALKTIINARL